MFSRDRLQVDLQTLTLPTYLFSDLPASLNSPQQRTFKHPSNFLMPLPQQRPPPLPLLHHNTRTKNLARHLLTLQKVPTRLQCLPRTDRIIDDNSPLPFNQRQLIRIKIKFLSTRRRGNRRDLYS